MSTTVRVLCSPAAAPGMALVGLPVDVVAPGADAAALLLPLLARKDVGVVLLEDSIHRTLPDDARRRADRSTAPVVLPFPSPAWQAAPAAEGYVVELLRRAIGYRVRLG